MECPTSSRREYVAVFRGNIYQACIWKTKEPWSHLRMLTLAHWNIVVLLFSTSSKKFVGRVCLFLSLDPQLKFRSDQSHTSLNGLRLPSKTELQESFSALRTSLALPSDRIHDIKQQTRNQSHTSLWYKARRYRLTASFFGAVSRHRPSTSPHSFVLSIVQYKSFESAATEWGKKYKDIALEKYVAKQEESGHSNLYACNSGFVTSE